MNRSFSPKNQAWLVHWHSASNLSKKKHLTEWIVATAGGYLALRILTSLVPRHPTLTLHLLLLPATILGRKRIPRWYTNQPSPSKTGENLHMVWGNLTKKLGKNGVFHRVGVFFHDFQDTKLALMMTSNMLHERFHRSTGIAFSSIYPGTLDGEGVTDRTGQLRRWIHILQVIFTSEQLYIVISRVIHHPKSCLN